MSRLLRQTGPSGVGARTQIPLRPRDPIRPNTLLSTLASPQEEKRRKKLDHAQEVRELLRVSGAVFIGIAGTILVAVANVVLGPWEVVNGAVVAQIIPVLLIAVILEGGVRSPPRQTRTGLKALYFVAFLLFVLTLLAGAAVSIVKTDLCQEIVDGIRLAEISAGLFTVSSGVFLRAIGAVLLLKIELLTRTPDGVVLRLGGSNQFRATDAHVSLNVLVPEGYRLFESDRLGRSISHKDMLDTPEVIDKEGFRDVTLWNYTWRDEWGISAGDHRLAYFHVKRQVGTPTAPLYVVVRADSEDLKGSRQQVAARFEI